MSQSCCRAVPYGSCENTKSNLVHARTLKVLVHLLVTEIATENLDEEAEKAIEGCFPRQVATTM